jgi:hypothetical protein
MFDLIVTFSYSAINPTYDFVTDLKFKDYDAGVIKDIYAFQERTKYKYKILLIFDDLVSTKMKEQDGIIQSFIRGRNANISIVVSTQIFNLISKKNRGNCDFMFIGKTNTAENRITMCEALLANNVKYPKNLRNKTERMEYLDKWLIRKTEDKHFIVVDMFDDAEKIYDYKAD